jgi:nucleotide-binding universal stress UspA family protein
MKILLAVDGSLCSQAAVKEVASRPWPAGSEVKVLGCVHVRTPNIPDPLLVYYAVYMEMIEAERKRISAVVEEVTTKLRQTRVDLKIDNAVIEGSPKEVILEEAEKWEADLIVVGCHGYGNVKRFLLGSVSQAVVLHAPCSVEIVRGHKAG